MLEEHGGCQRVYVLLATAGAAFLLADGAERAGRAHPLVPEVHRQAGSPRNGLGQFAGFGGAGAFGAVEGQRETDDRTDRRVISGKLEQPRHREPLPPTAGERLERRSEGLGLVAQREPDPHCAPIDAEDPAMRGDHRDKGKR